MCIRDSANAERYIIPELKELEDTILGAEDKLYALEYQLYSEVRDTIGKEVVRIQKTAKAIAKLDAFASLALVAEQNNYEMCIRDRINTVSRFNMLIAIPCAVGFITLAKPILNLLYFTQDNTTAARMLQMGALSVVFFCLSTVTNSVLQGLDDMMTPVKNAAISLVIHIVTLFLMLVVLKWNIYAVVLSKIIFSGAICILLSLIHI